eukprot:4960571-Amphidinium_carterae.1
MDCLSLCGKASLCLRHWRDGRTEEALQGLAELSTADPSSFLWPTMQVRMYLDKGASQDALSICNRLIEVHQTCPGEVYALRGFALQAAGKTPEARHDLERACALGGLNSADLERMSSLGVTPKPTSLATVAPAPSLKPAAAAQVHAAKSEGKQEIAKAPVSSTPDKKAESLMDAALKHEGKGELALAMEKCNDALGQRAHYPQAVLCLARIALANGDFDAVARILQRQHPSVMKIKAYR